MLESNNSHKAKFLFKQINSSIIDLLFVILLSILILISLINFSGFLFTNFGVPENPFLNDIIFRKFLNSLFNITLVSSLFNFLFFSVLKKESFGENIGNLKIKGNSKLKTYLFKGLTKYLFIYLIPILLFYFNAFSPQAILIYWLLF
ncbi:MAG TPA: hypothetical protein DD434_00190, partial [Bacteroidales bacterium]|nr:hypothetical protein [Bacteroidales bacterium]